MLMVGPAFWGGQAPAAPGFDLPYTMDLDGFADKAAMLAFYAGLGIVIEDPEFSAFVRESYLTSTYDPFDEQARYFAAYPADGNPETPYLLYRIFTGAEFTLSIDIPAAYMVQRAELDFSYGGTSLQLRAHYDTGATNTRSLTHRVAGFPMERISIPLAESVPGGAAYLDRIDFIVSASGANIAIDNITLI